MSKEHFAHKAGFKHTPVGWIPEEWEVVKLSKLVTKVGSGITPSGGSKVYKNEGRLFLRSQNVGWGVLLLDDVVFIDENTHNTFRSTEIKENDIFLNITGASIGRSAVADNRVITGNVNQHVCIIRTIKSSLNPYFLNYFLLSSKGQNLIDGFQAGGNRQGLNFEQIKSFPIPLPSHAEQLAISNILSKWDKAINGITQLIAQKELRKKWLMQQLLTGKKRLPGFEGEWKEVRLGSVGKFSKGSGIAKAEVRAEGLPCVRYGEIYTTHDIIIQKFCSFINNESAKLSKRISNGDILFAGSGETVEDIGKAVAFLGEGDAYAGGDIIIFRPEDINSLFLSYLLNSEEVNRQKAAMGKGHSVVHIYSKDLAEIIICLPKAEEQAAIAAVLSTADKEIQLLKNKLSQLKEQKKGLMQVLLTGKKRLRTT